MWKTASIATFGTAISLALQTGASAQPEAAAAPRDQMICKRYVETGSLVRGYKSCKTKREWEIERDLARERMSGTGTGCNEPSSAACSATTVSHWGTSSSNP